MDVRLRFEVLLTVVLCVNIGIVSSKNVEVNVERYDFSSYVEIGCPIANVFSKYEINGYIKLSKLPKYYIGPTYIVKLDELSHKIKGDIVTNDPPILTDYMDHLSKPFLVTYDSNMKWPEIRFQGNETILSKNFKKSIASFLKPNVTTFFTDFQLNRVEDTIHGSCDVGYTKYEVSDMHVVPIVRTYDPTNCFINKRKEIFHDMNLEFEKVDANISTVYFVNSNEMKSQEIVNKYIYDWYSSRNNKNYKQRVAITHYLNNYTSLSALIDFNKSMFSDLHDILIFEKNIITNRDSESNYEKLKNYLVEASQYLTKDRLVKYIPGSEHDQILNKIQLILDDFQSYELEHFYHNFRNYDIYNKEMARQIFIQMVPYSGTEASLLFIKSLMKKGDVSDDEAIYLLQTLASYMHKPSLKTLLEFKDLINENDPSSLSITKAGVLSFSYLLSRVYENQPSEEYNELLSRYLEYFNDAIEAASNIEMKLVYIMAFRNTESAKAVPYLLSILEEKGTDVESSDRLRLAAIYALSKCADTTAYSAYEKIMEVLEDDTESRTIRIFAYDTLMDKSSLTEDELMRIDETVSHDAHLRNYHWSYLINLKTENMLTKIYDEVVRKIDYKQFCEKLSKTVLVERQQKLSFEESFILKKSIITDDNIPIAVKIDNVEKVGKKFISYYGIYMNSNLQKLKSIDGNLGDLKPYFDIWLSLDSWVFNVKSYDFSLSDVQSIESNLISPLNFNSFNYHRSFIRYRKLKSFSIPTSFGVDAVFQNRMPFLMDIQLNVNKETDYSFNLNFVFDFWYHGYKGISIMNPMTGLLYTVKKSLLMDVSVPIKISFDLDVLRRKFQITLPLDTSEYKLNQGFKNFISTSIIVTDVNGEFIPYGGYKILSAPSPIFYAAQKFFIFDIKNIGLQVVTSIYDCDTNKFSPLSTKDAATFDNIKCGIQSVIKPNFATFTQLEIITEVNLSLYPYDLEKPKYYLPGYQFALKLSLQGKNKYNDEMLKSIGLEMSGNYLKGQTFSSSKLKIFKLNSLNADCLQYSKCQYIHADFDIHAPIYAVNSVSKKILYDVQALNYISSPFKENIKTLFTVNHTTLLNENTNSECSTMINPMHLHPIKYPENWKCLMQLMIDNNLTYSEEKMESITVPIPIEVESSTIVLLFWRKYLINVMSEYVIKKNNNVTFENEYPISSLLKSDLIRDSMEKLGSDDIKIIHVLPGAIINEESEVIKVDLTDNREIHRNSEADYKILVKVIENLKLEVNVYHESHYVTLEVDSAEINMEQSPTSTIRVYFDNDLIIRQSYFGKRLNLPYESNNDCLFGLFEVDGFTVLQLKKYPLIVYYSPNSIHIIYNNNSEAYNYQCY